MTDGRCEAACGSKPSFTTASTRQSAHILMTSTRLALAPWNIQCLSPSLASTRWIELLVPNGLPQAMQLNGSSSFSTRGGAFQALKSRRGSSVMTFSGQVDSQSPHWTHRLSVKRSIARSGLSDRAPVGQAVTQAWQSVQPSTFSFTPPNGAPGANGTTSTGAGAARWSSRKVVSSTLRLAPRGTKQAGFRVATPAGAASSEARNWSG